jgi:hypothetical protein
MIHRIQDHYHLNRLLFPVFSSHRASLALDILHFKYFAPLNCHILFMFEIDTYRVPARINHGTKWDKISEKRPQNCPKNDLYGQGKRGIC